MNTLLRSTLAISIGLALVACGSDDEPAEDEVIVVAPVAQQPTEQVTQKQSGSLTIVVVDAATGLHPVDEGGVNIPVSYTLLQDVARLVNLKGEALTEADAKFENSDNAVSLALGAIAATELVKINVIAEADGYFPNNIVAQLSVEQSEPVVTIRLTPKALPDDIQVDVETSVQPLTDLATNVVFDSTTGVITADSPMTITVDVQQDGEASTGGAAITLPSGTALLAVNEAGESVPLTSAPEVAIGYYSNEALAEGETDATPAESAIDYFPGGLAVDLQGNDGATEGDFLTGGFVAIEITDDAGNKVKTFGKNDDGSDKSIEVKMQVDVNTNNACPMVFGTSDIEQGAVTAFAEDASKATDGAYFKQGVCEASAAARKIESGDIIPIWSYEETAGSWQFESYGVAVENADNAAILDVVVQVNHLSFWNLDYFLKGTQRCASQVRFALEDKNGNPNAVSATLLLEAQGGGARFLRKGYEWGGADSAIFYRPPAYPVTIQFLVDGENVLLGTQDDAVAGQPKVLQVAELCELEGETLVLDVEAPEVHDQTIKTSLVCDETGAAAGTIFPEPIATSTYVYLYKDTYQFYYTDNSGEALAENLETGADYTAYVYDFANNRYITSTVTATSADDTINLEIPTQCEVIEQPVTGGTGGTGAGGTGG